MRWGVISTILIVLTSSPAVAWGAKEKTVVTHIVCPLCATDNDLTAWDGAHEYRCTHCSLPLRYPRSKTLEERLEKRLATFQESFGSVHGSLMFEGTRYRDEGGVDARTDKASTKLRLQWKRSFRSARTFVDAFVANDTLNESRGVERFPARHSAAVGLREAFVDATLVEVDYRVGKQLWSWGKTDLVHLVDVLNPEDRTNLFHEERLGTWGAMFTRRFGDTDVDVVFVPRLSPTLPPSARSRFAIIPFDLEQAVLDNLRESVAVRMVRTDFDVDWSIIGMTGAELLPSVFVTSPFMPPSLAYSKQQMVGVTFETVLGNFGFRGETAYTHPEDETSDEHANIVLGLDRTWNDVVMDRDRLYLNIEGTVERVLREGRWIEFPRPFTRTVAAKVEYAHERWVPSLILVHSFGREGTLPLLKDGDSYIEAVVRFERTDYDEMEIRADVPFGSPQSFFGAQESNGSISALWRVRF